MATVTVEVPATSANLGPGFDCLGLALSLPNSIEVEPLDEPRFEVEVAGAGWGVLPTDGRNLVAVSMKRLFERVGGAPRGARIRQQNGIPLCSGLGSSAAARVAGLLAANRLCGDPLDLDALAALATQLEGHPDNVMPALVAGLVVAVVDDGRVSWVRFDPPALTAVVGMPRQALATADSRRALPTSYAREDVVFNVSRAGLLIASLVTGRFDQLSEAMADRIHQPYRLPLIPGAQAVLDAALAAGACGAAISGAGPSILALCDGRQEAVEDAMRDAWAKHGVSADVRCLALASDGARVAGSGTGHNASAPAPGG